MANPKHIVILLTVTVVLVGGLAWWAGAKNATPLPVVDLSDELLPAPLTPEELSIMEPEIKNATNPIARLETTAGTIAIELYEDVMPITAGNFAELVSNGFYDGIKFHRVIDGFMIQGGDPETKTDNVARYGTGGPGYEIADEFVELDYLSNIRGTISMANSGPNTGGSQFFINLVDNVALDFDKQPLTSRHPVFGQVVEGMEIVDAIAKTPTNQRDLPLEDVVIVQATLERPE